MKRLQRKSNPGVTAGRVQKKNRTDRSVRFDTAVLGYPVVHRLKPGFGYRHVLRQRDVLDFVGLLPDWPRLSQGLNALVLAPGVWNCDGWYRPGIVAVCAWERDLWREVSGSCYTAHRDLFERLEVPCEEVEGGYYLCRFTEATARAYQLLHVLLHELGHHHDCMTTRSKADAARGEGYAEDYAYEHERTVWERYLAAFSLY
jgi:hypothetical protein